MSVFAATADSVGYENLDGKKLILHKLDPKDNYYSIGRRYNVRPAVIIAYNNNAPLQIGNIIKVPTEQPFLQSAPNPTQLAQQQQARTYAQQYAQQQQIAAQQQQAKANAQPAPQQQPQITAQQLVQKTSAAPVNNAGVTVQEYRISAGETLYSIAKRFDSTVEDITAINGLTSTNLTLGQIIKVRSGVPPPVAAVPPPPRPIAKRDSTSAAFIDSSNYEKHLANRYGLYEKTEKGVATWIDDPSLDPNKKMVLHRTAPNGTIIKITNPMTGRTTFAKVVGKIYDSESTKDVIIEMTKNVAESIGGLDKRIHVTISYGSPTN